MKLDQGMAQVLPCAVLTTQSDTPWMICKHLACHRETGLVQPKEEPNKYIAWPVCTARAQRHADTIGMHDYPVTQNMQKLVKQVKQCYNKRKSLPPKSPSMSVLWRHLYLSNPRAQQKHKFLVPAELLGTSQTSSPRCQCRMQ